MKQVLCLVWSLDLSLTPDLPSKGFGVEEMSPEFGRDGPLGDMNLTGDAELGLIVLKSPMENETNTALLSAVEQGTSRANWVDRSSMTGNFKMHIAMSFLITVIRGLHHRTTSLHSGHQTTTRRS